MFWKQIKGIGIISEITGMSCSKVALLVNSVEEMNFFLRKCYFLLNSKSFSQRNSVPFSARSFSNPKWITKRSLLKGYQVRMCPPWFHFWRFIVRAGTRGDRKDEEHLGGCSSEGDTVWNTLNGSRFCCPIAIWLVYGRLQLGEWRVLQGHHANDGYSRGSHCQMHTGSLFNH